MAAREIYLEIGKVNQREKSLKVALTKRIFKLGLDRQWSDFLVSWPELDRRHAFFLREGNDYRIYGGGDRDPERFALAIKGQPIDVENGYLLSHGDLITVGHRPTVYLRYYNVTTSSAPSPDVGGNVNIASSLPPAPSGSPVQLDNRDLFAIGCEDEADLQLVASTVMENHAMLVKKRHRYWLHNSDGRSTFVNEKFVKRKVPLKQGDVVRIGPYFILFSPRRLDVITSGNQVQIGARQISVALGRFLKRKQILNEITLTCQTGELVALVGGSGAGKSTLMKALLGIAPVTSGELLINGHELKQHFNLYRTSIGYVPQDDIIHTGLTVNEVLTYACRLRLPPRSPIREIVNRALQQVDMSSVRNSLVSKLSGGQRKRVSIAVELLSDPQMLFLDEPTSGLDPGLDRQLMELLEDIAKQGRLVVLVTHATENIGVCDRIAFLGSGGRLCYFGPPAGAVNFFKRHSPSVNSFTDIYHLFNQDDRVERAKVIAQYWQAKNRHAEESVRHQDAMPKKAIRPNRPQASRLRQWVTLSRRYLKLTLRDYRSAAISLITAPIAIALIKLPLPDEEPLASMTGSVTQAPLALKTLFVITCAALWVGLSSSIQEIVKESSIYRRERLINLGLLTYVGSKLLVRALLALGQTSLIVWIVMRLFEAPSPEVIGWPLGLGISTFLTLVSASSLGLLTSAIADSEAAANSLLPLVLLPQIIFSGVLFDLQGVASKVSWLTISRWSMGAYGALVDVNAMVPESKTVPGITLPPPPFEVSSVYAPDISNLLLNWLILLVQTVFYAILTAVIQRRKDDI